MNEIVGEIFSISETNKIISGCTVSKSIYSKCGLDINYFSMDALTEISAETYEYQKLCIVNYGKMKIYTKNTQSQEVSRGEIMALYKNIPVGIKTNIGCIYTEIALPKETKMNKILKEGEVFKLSNLVQYQEDRIVNMDLIDEPNLKFVVMSFDKGTGLAEHSAPGDALIFALEGSGIIGYEGREYKIKSGENFRFAKNAKHWVKADDKFKMALLLIIE